MVGTLDDNARALVAMCQHFELTNDSEDLIYDQYYQFIHFCQQKTALFELCKRTKKIQNQNSENLEILTEEPYGL
jgi:hypothetical protein